jgi:hypothetical protein
MESTPVDLIERLRNAGDDPSADSVADIARSLAMVKRYLEEIRGVTPGNDSPEGKCLEAVNFALERVKHPL